MDASLSNLLQPGQHRLGIERELRDHGKVVATLQDRGLLVQFGLPQLRVSDVGVAFGVARNADPSDSIFCKESGTDDRQCVLKWAHRLRRVACNDEGMIGSHFTLQGGEEAF